MDERINARFDEEINAAVSHGESKRVWNVASMLIIAKSTHSTVGQRTHCGSPLAENSFETRDLDKRIVRRKGRDWRRRSAAT